MLKTFEVHSKYRNIERHSKCILTAFWLHSKYSYGIPTAFETFWSHSRENRNGKPLLFQVGLAGGQQSGAKQHGPGGPYSMVAGLRLMKMLDSAAFYTLSVTIPAAFLVHSGHSCYILSTFEVHSKYSSCILFEFLDVQTTFGGHSGSVLTAFEVNSYSIRGTFQPDFGRYSGSNRTALVRHSKCILNILTAF